MKVLMGLLGSLFALFGATQGGAAASWPTLPETGFIAGRVANEDDLKRGDAVFLTKIDGKPSGSPAPIRVPQLAYLVTEQGEQLKVVVVQAETTDQGVMLGLRDATGGEYVATAAEVRLLGPTPPR